ncbi:putative membrane protein [Clostridium sporogenes]|uniref:Putative membrane protein n=1 Tax=Clostridium sporogenes TaxID=1509 RepID=A0A1L3NJV6_CLOSG|nr:putative membrane protein [Clostridium sporogenes]
MFSFILTMWYVNEPYYDIVGVKTLGFYINYVVCKLEKRIKEETEVYAFILTMWYVNVADVAAEIIVNTLLY